MKKTKSRIIKYQGNSVTVTRYTSTLPIVSETKALIGRMAKTTTNMLQLESYKEGIFLPDFDIDSGDFVYNLAQNENYVVSGTHHEPFRNTTISVIATMLKCNHILSVKKMEKVADNRGNLKPELTTKFSGIPCFVTQVTDEMRQMDSGIHQDTEYMIHTTALDMKSEDQVTLAIYGKDETFKVVALDYVSFPKMLVLEACRDVRK